MYHITLTKSGGTGHGHKDNAKEKKKRQGSNGQDVNQHAMQAQSKHTQNAGGISWMVVTIARRCGGCLFRQRPVLLPPKQRDGTMRATYQIPHSARHNRTAVDERNLPIRWGTALSLLHGSPARYNSCFTTTLSLFAASNASGLNYIILFTMHGRPPPLRRHLQPARWGSGR